MLENRVCESAFRWLRPRVPALVLATLFGLGTIQRAFPVEASLTIERLLDEGWEVAGYAGTLDNRSALILFRNKDKKYLVQCSTLYDVTRASRITLNCYELH